MLPCLMAPHTSLIDAHCLPSLVSGSPVEGSHFQPVTTAHDSHLVPLELCCSTWLNLATSALVWHTAHLLAGDH